MKKLSRFLTDWTNLKVKNIVLNGRNIDLERENKHLHLENKAYDLENANACNTIVKLRSEKITLLQMITLKGDPK